MRVQLESVTLKQHVSIAGGKMPNTSLRVGRTGVENLVALDGGVVAVYGDGSEFFVPWSGVGAAQPAKEHTFLPKVRRQLPKLK